jgi:hypothetical protein
MATTGGLSPTPPHRRRPDRRGTVLHVAVARVRGPEFHRPQLAKAYRGERRGIRLPSSRGQLGIEPVATSELRV